MAQFFREYGLIGLLIAVALGGYFMLGDEREDILASSLDALGSHLTALVDDSDAKALTESDFEAFKAAVAANEIAPEDVERVAASVLNLTASGAKLTPDEAKMVLDLAFEGESKALPIPEMKVDVSASSPPEPSAPMASIDPAPARAEAPPKPPQKAAVDSWSAESSKRVGNRVSVMVELADQMRSQSTEAAKEFGNHVRFVVRDGLRVIVDSTVVPIWKEPDFKSIAGELERERVVIWDKNLGEARRQHAEQLKSERRMIDRAKAAAGTLPPQEADKIKALEQLHRLREMGLILDVDSLQMRAELDQILKKVLDQVEKEINSALEEVGTGLDEDAG